MPRRPSAAGGALLRSPPVYEKKVGKAYLRGCLKMLAVGAAGAVVGVALVASTLFLIRGGDVQPRGPRFTLALALPLLMMAALLVVVVAVVRLRARRLDRAFAPWQLCARQAGAAMRSWHGEIGGRAFDAWFHRGPTLELYLACTPATRGVIHRGGALVRALSRAVASREPMEPRPVDLEGASVYADDPAWMERLLARPDVRAAVGALMAETRRTASGVFVAPDAVRYLRRFLPPAELDADNLRRWIAGLEALAAAVDGIGPSTDSLAATKAEVWARTSRDRYLNAILLALGLGLLLAMALLFVFGWLFVGQS